MIRPLIFGLLMLPATLCGAEPAAPAVQSLTDIVLPDMTPPIRIRLQVECDGLAWKDYFRQSQEAYYSALFAWADADGDGRLSEAEAGRIPPPVIRLDPSLVSTANIAFNFRVLDGDGDGFAGRDDLARYYAAYSDGPLLISRPGDQGNTLPPLFARLDANLDKVLDEKELSRAESLWEADRNTDGLLTAEEVSTATQVSGSEFVATPGVSIPPTTRVRLMAADNSIPTATLTVKYAEFGTLPTLSLQTEQPDHVKLVGDRLVLTRDKFRLELLVPVSPLRLQQQLAGTLLREFSAAADGETTVAPETTPAPYLKEQRLLADGNLDGALTREELGNYLEKFLPALFTARAARLTLTVRPGLGDLAGSLDNNADGRISRKELTAARIRELPAIRDGKLAQNDQPTILRLSLGREHLPAPYVNAALPDSGPIWFTRFDQNLDGDLSPAEFPGNGELFQKLDGNADGFIDLNEALRVEQSDRPAKTSAEGT